MQRNNEESSVNHSDINMSWIDEYVAPDDNLTSDSHQDSLNLVVRQTDLLDHLSEMLGFDPEETNQDELTNASQHDIKNFAARVKAIQGASEHIRKQQKW